MPSQVPGFEYDIFISYRQNDNKPVAGSEGWVTDFVNNLSAELESVVKGRVSIYFDKNPHHGLQETHNVDESLAGKLNAVILMPVVSQTYCDPESFAWKQEFLPFLEKAASDSIGLSVKLLNGNATSRVLPIRIHEIDADDLNLIESELKGRLRPVDFIFRSSGVNRPLRPFEEDPLKNTLHTLYRDQLNKAAIAIKDILAAVKHYDKSGSREKPIPQDVFTVTSKARSNSFAIIPLIQEDSEGYFTEGVAEFLHSLFAKIKSIRLAGLSPSQNVRDTRTGDLTSKLGANTVLLVQTSLRKNSVLVDLKAVTGGGTALYTCTHTVEPGALINLLKSTMKDVAAQCKLEVRDNEWKLIAQVQETNAVSLENYFQGRWYLRHTGADLLKSITFFQSAIKTDPDFARSYASLAYAYVNAGYYQLLPFSEAIRLSEEAALKSLHIDVSQMDAYHALTLVCMCYELSWPEAEPYFLNIQGINPAGSQASERYASWLTQIKKHLDHVRFEELTIPYFITAFAHLHRGRPEEAQIEASRAIEKDPNSFMAHRAMGLSHMALERYPQAIESLEKASSLSNRQSGVLFELMGAYMLHGRLEEAKQIMEETLMKSYALPSRVHDFFFPLRK